MAFLDNQGVSKLCALLKDKFDSLWTAVNGKQGALTAGSNITISGNTISATDTTYTAGTNVSISNGVISATDTNTTYTAGTGINIDANNEISCTVSGGSSYSAGNSGIYIDTNYIYNNYLPQHGIPIGLFYNSTKESTNRGLTPSIDYCSTVPSVTSFLEGKLLLCSTINNSQTYNVADLFPDGNTMFCQIVQVKPSGIDWANATTFNSFVGTTVSLTFYYKNYIKVGNIIFYWLNKSYWSSNENAVYNDDAVQMIREALFPEIFSSSGSSLPSDPSNDGTYLLKCVVSSGTPTYSWESVTVGGSY